MADILKAFMLFQFPILLLFILTGITREELADAWVLAELFAYDAVLFFITFTLFGAFLKRHWKTTLSLDLPAEYKTDQPWRQATDIRLIERLKGEILDKESKLRIAHIDTTLFSRIRARKGIAAELQRAALRISSLVSRFFDGNRQAVEAAQELGYRKLCAQIDQLWNRISNGNVHLAIAHLDAQIDKLKLALTHCTSVERPALEGQMIDLEHDRRDLKRQFEDKSTKEEITPDPVRDNSERAAKVIEREAWIKRVVRDHARFKAEKDRLDIKKKEARNIAERRASGEYTDEEASSMMRTLNEIFSEDD